MANKIIIFVLVNFAFEPNFKKNENPTTKNIELNLKNHSN